MKREGPDSLEGLIIAVICCLIYTLMSGTAGLASMLFVACITRYNTDRNRASLPFTICSVLQAMSGPFIGYLAKKFGLRLVVLAGAVLGPLGIAVCYLAEDIIEVMVFWGIIFGIGFGLSTLLLPAIINDYFIKQRSKALGLCYLGSPIGFLIFPPIFEVLLQKYGLSGTFLLLAGINMHCIPLSLWIKKPKFKGKTENCLLNSGKAVGSYSSIDRRLPNRACQSEFENVENSTADNKVKTHLRRYSVEFLWNKPDSSEHLTKQYVLSLNKKCDEANKRRDILRSFKNCSKDRYIDIDGALSKLEQTGGGQNEQSYHSGISSSFNYEPTSTKVVIRPNDVSVGKITNYEKLDLPKDQSYEECSTICLGRSNRPHNSVVDELDAKNQTDVNVVVCNSNGHYHVKSDLANHFTNEVHSNPKLLVYKRIDESSNSTRNNVYLQQDIRIQDARNAVHSPSSSLLSLYFNPIFILLCIINAISSLHFTTLTTVIIDFSMDLKIETDNQKYIMMCLSIMGAIGMLGFGWVTDGGYLTRTKFGALSQLIGSVSTALLPFTVGFETLMIAVAAWCVCQASFIPLIPAIIAEYIEEEFHAVAISACFVLCGPLYLIIPPLIGYFRDDLGSYDNIFFLLGTLSFVNCIAVFIIPYLSRWRSRR